MKRLPIILTAFLIIVIALGAPEPAHAAGEYSIRASTDRTNAVVGDRIILTVTVSTTRGISIQPQIPDLKDFDIAGTSTSNHISIINGAQSMEMSYIYALRPIKAGKLSIGEFSIAFQDATGAQRTEKTKPIQIDVAEENARAEGPPPTAEPEKPPVEMPKAEAKKDLLSNFMLVSTAAVLSIFGSMWLIMWQSARRERAAEVERRAAAARNGKIQLEGGGDHAADGGHGKGGVTAVREAKNAAQQGAAGNGRAAAGGRAASAGTEPDAAAAFDAAQVERALDAALAAGDARTAAGAMSRLVRHAAGIMAGACLMEATTAEIERAAADKRFDAESADSISSALGLCDMVLYAKYPAGPEEVRQAAEKTKRIYNKVKRGA